MVLSAICELMLLLFHRRHHQCLHTLLSIPWQQSEQMQGIPATYLVVCDTSLNFKSCFAVLLKTALRLAASCELF